MSNRAPTIEALPRAAEILRRDDVGALDLLVVAGGLTPTNRVENSHTGGRIVNALRELGTTAVIVDPEQPGWEDEFRGAENPFALLVEPRYMSFEERLPRDVRSTLDHLGIPYSGPDLTASRLTADKDSTKRIGLSSGIHTPDWLVLGAGDRLGEEIHLPVVVKPLDQSAGLGVRYCDTIDTATEHAEGLIARFGAAMVERYAPGPELSVPLLRVGGESYVFPVVETILLGDRMVDDDAPNSFYLWDHRLPADLPGEVLDAAVQNAVRLAAGMGWRGLLRVDFKYDPSVMSMALIEANGHPGLSPIQGKTVLSAMLIGRTLGDVLAWLIACARGALP